MTHVFLFPKQKETHRHKKHTYGYQRQKGGEEDNLGGWTLHTHATVCKIYNQQGPTIWQRELCSILCYNLSGKRI